MVEEHFGARAGRSISLLYFLSIFPILLIYGVGITNTVDSFMVNQAGMEALPRELLSGVLVFALIAIMMAGEKSDAARVCRYGVPTCCDSRFPLILLNAELDNARA